MTAEEFNPVGKDIFEKRYDISCNAFRTLGIGKPRVVIAEMGVREVPHHHYQVVAIIVDLNVANFRMGSGKDYDNPISTADLHRLILKPAVERCDQTVRQ